MYAKVHNKFVNKCYTLLEQMRNDIRCASCDPFNNAFVNGDEKTIIFKRSDINRIIMGCYNLDMYETTVFRDLMLAYLNYAKQLRPDLDIDHSILFEIFPKKIQGCIEWVKFTGANTHPSDVDYTKSRECLNYAYEKLNAYMRKPQDIFLSSKWKYFMNVVVKALAVSDLKEELDLLFPEILNEHLNEQ